MKYVNMIALGILIVLSSPVKSNSLTLEERLSLLEQKVNSTEQRAIAAETELRTLKAEKQKETSNIKTNFKDVNVKFNGDVEFNADSFSKTGSMFNKDNYPKGNNENWGLNGRILLGVKAEQKTTTGNVAGVNVQPLADMSGKMNLDDTLFYFGKENDWNIKVGRFESFDMFPLNQDTFIQYSGNTANDIYQDGFGYIYQMKEGRGRSNSGGSLLVNKTIDNWYLETNFLIEDGSQLFVDNKYHGNKLVNKKNVVYVRPVVSYNTGDWTTSVGMESNVIKNAYGYTDSDKKFIDQSKRTGYGFTVKYDNTKTDHNGVVINLNTAYLDASNEKDFTTGINGLWNRFELGYIYAHNEIDKNIPIYSCEDNCDLFSVGKYDIHTVHLSYQIPDILNIPNFNIYIGGYASYLENSKIENKGSNERYGARLRFKYFF